MVNGFHYNIKDRMDSFALVYLYVYFVLFDLERYLCKLIGSNFRDAFGCVVSFCEGVVLFGKIGTSLIV